MTRGDLVTIAMQGDYGKPRPALVIQSDRFAGLDSVTVLPVTSHDANAPLFRVPLPSGELTGLTKPSFVMVDKAATLPRAKIGGVIGRVPHDLMVSVERSLMVFLGVVA